MSTYRRIEEIVYFTDHSVPNRKCVAIIICISEIQILQASKINGLKINETAPSCDVLMKGLTQPGLPDIILSSTLFTEKIIKTQTT